MRRTGLALWAGLICASHGAWAEGCPVPPSTFADVVCADDRVMATWGTMEKAFATASAAMPDDAARQALQGSQDNWLAAMLLADPIRAEDAGTAIAERSAVLKGMPETLAAMRAFRGQFSGGALGNDLADCFYVGRDLTDEPYLFCGGVMRVQQGNTLCSVDLEWATGQAYSTIRIGRVEADGRLTPQAECSLDSSEMCGEVRPWITDKAQLTAMPSRPADLSRLDAQTGGDLDLWGALGDEWTLGGLAECLAGT